MPTTAEVLDAATIRSGLDPTQLVDAVEALQACVVACTACADACLEEPDPAALRRCIRLDLDCADVCAATLAVLARTGPIDPSLIQSVVQTCVAFCQVCGQECADHADHHDHCARCAEACSRCEEACLRLLEGMEAAATRT